MHTALNDKAYNVAPVLYMAFELSDKNWKLVSSDGNKRRQKTVEACAQGEVLEQIVEAKRRFKLPAGCPVVSCYEAGWEGFWLARWLESEGIVNYVVDSSSIETSRRRRRVKTDRVDGDKLVGLLVRYARYGEREALRVVRVPSREAEDNRRLHRERDVLVKERGRHWVRIKSLLRAQGLRVTGKRGFLKQLDALRCWDGQALPESLRAEIEREWARYEQVNAQIKVLEAQQQARVAACAGEEDLVQIERLLKLRGIGWQGAWPLVMELFAWRRFNNRRELGALVGLTGTPYSSGEDERDQGISKAGNKRLRRLLIELAWSWLRYQPDSALSRWYQQRFGSGKRLRRIGIVALARKLLVALWRYLDQGVVPEGARLAA